MIRGQHGRFSFIADPIDEIFSIGLMFCSSMLTGSHDATQLPIVLVGRAGGQLETGRVLNYLDQPNRKMCSLYLSLMDKFDVRLDEFGDSRERLAEI